MIIISNVQSGLIKEATQSGLPFLAESHPLLFPRPQAGSPTLNEGLTMMVNVIPLYYNPQWMVMPFYSSITHLVSSYHVPNLPQGL